MTAPGSVPSGCCALQSRYRYEQRVVQQLTAKGFETDLPDLPVVHQWKDSGKAVVISALAGYLFSRFEQTLQYRVPILGMVARISAKLCVFINVTSVCQARAVEVFLDDIAAVEHSKPQPHEYLSSAWTIDMRLPQKDLRINAFSS